VSRHYRRIGRKDIMATFIIGSAVGLGAYYVLALVVAGVERFARRYL